MTNEIAQAAGASSSRSRTVKRVPVSVVIPTVGRASLLRDLLESLQASDPAPREIVVVDQSDDERTDEVVRAFRDLRVRRIADDQTGVAAARNQGVLQARCDAVLFTDDDCVVAPDWVGRAWNELNEHPAAIVTGKVLPAGDAREVPSTKSASERRDYTGAVSCSVLYTGNMVVDRRRLLEAGGFDERLRYGSDNDLCYRWLRSGGRLFYDPGMVVWHQPWRNREEIAALYREYARAQGVLYAKHLRAGDLTMLRFVASDLVAGARGSAARVLRRRPAWSDSRQAILANLPRGLWAGWRREPLADRARAASADHTVAVRE